MHGEEETLHGDSGYIGAEKRPEAVKKNKQGKKIKYIINRKQSSINKLSKSGQYAAKKKEHEKSSVRCKVEHVFAVVKRLFGYRKTRYRGLRKQMLLSDIKLDFLYTPDCLVGCFSFVSVDFSIYAVLP